MDGMLESEHRSFDKKEKKIKELSILAEINKEIHSTMHINRLLQILVEKAVVGVNFERCLVYLLEGDYLRCAAWIDGINKERASIIKKTVGFRMDETGVEVLSAKMGKTIYIKNARTDKRISPKLLRISDTKEYCVVPLIGRNEVLGVFTGDKHYSNEPILAEDIETLKLFVSHISLAIENAKLYQEKENFNLVLEKTVQERTFELRKANRLLSEKMDELSTLYQMGQLLNKSIEKDEVLQQIVALVQSLGYEMLSIRAYDAAGTAVVVSMGLDKDYEALDDVSLLGRKERQETLGTEAPFFVNDLISAPISSSFRKYCVRKKIRSSLEVPIIAKGTLSGIMRIYSHKSGFFNEDQKDFFFLFGQQLNIALENAMRFKRLVDEKKHVTSISSKIEQENLYLKEKSSTDFVIGKSPSMKKVMDLVQNVAQTSATVLIYGETGSGKELIAREIHEASLRKKGPMINVNCAAIPEDLIESELFGHEKGSFTGAHQRHIGMFELSQGGTLFLDEIGELSLRTQTKLLRVLQEQEIQRLGANKVIPLDIRVIAATNRDLQASVNKWLFRADLFYRLNIFPITVPPLRERTEDIPELVDSFIKKHSKARKNSMMIEKEVMKIFFNYSWPGNVRELENVIERLVIISKSNIITKNDLPKEIWRQASLEFPEKPLNEAILDFKRDMINSALIRANGKKAKAARMLGLARSNFSRLQKTLDRI